MNKQNRAAWPCAPETRWTRPFAPSSSGSHRLVIRAFAFEPFNIPRVRWSQAFWSAIFCSFPSMPTATAASRRSSVFCLLKAVCSERNQARRRDRVQTAFGTTARLYQALIGLPGDNIQVKSGLLYVKRRGVVRRKLAEPVAENIWSQSADPPIIWKRFRAAAPMSFAKMRRLSFGRYGSFHRSVRPLFFHGRQPRHSQDSRTNMVALSPPIILSVAPR